MNREIKFRGLRDTESGGVEMVYGQVSMDNNQNCTYYKTHPDRIHWRTESGGHASAPVRKGTVGQYTGLKDKNGVEIYEGDVVETDFPSFPKGFVKYSSYTCAYVLATEGSTVFFISDLVRNKWKLEVIGNIYENPELLNS